TGVILHFIFLKCLLGIKMMHWILMKLSSHDWPCQCTELVEQCILPWGLFACVRLRCPELRTCVSSQLPSTRAVQAQLSPPELQADQAGRGLGKERWFISRGTVLQSSTRT
uniref:Uncharacterized protein n=1 Tax=Serinus canaria TaxID=9135 RepID=A0A8C9NK93_SERCA